jgi:hypothetical protein
VAHCSVQWADDLLDRPALALGRRLHLVVAGVGVVGEVADVGDVGDERDVVAGAVSTRRSRSGSSWLRHLPLRPHPGPGRRLLDRHAAAHGVGLAARRPRLQLHPHRHHRPLPAHAGKAVFYPMGWDDNGLPTERRVENFYGVRCDPSVPYDPGFTGRPPAGPRTRTSSPSAAATSSSCANELTARPTSRSSRTCSATSGCRSTGRSPTPRSAIASPRISQRAFLRNLARGEAYSARRRRRLWDVTFQTAVAQAELEDRERPAPTTTARLPPHRRRRRHGHRHHPARAARQLRRLVAHPDDERYQPLFGTTVTTPCSASRSRSRPPSRRARQGHRHRDDLHLRRPHRRHLVARARPADPGRHRRDGRFAADPPDWLSTDEPPATPTPASPARPPKRRPEEDGRTAAPSRATCSAMPKKISTR